MPAGYFCMPFPRSNVGGGEGAKTAPVGLLPGNQSRGLLCPPGISSRTHLVVYDQACYLGSWNGGTRTVFLAILGVGDSYLVDLEPFFLILGPY
jgi:hypothetical protein